MILLWLCFAPKGAFPAQIEKPQTTTNIVCSLFAGEEQKALRGYDRKAEEDEGYVGIGFFIPYQQRQHDGSEIRHVLALTGDLAKSKLFIQAVK